MSVVDVEFSHFPTDIDTEPGWTADMEGSARGGTPQSGFSGNLFSSDRCICQRSRRASAFQKGKGERGHNASNC